MKCGGNPAENLDWPSTGILAQGQVIEVDWQSNDDQHDDIWHQKGSASILVAQVGKSPKVAQSHCHAQSGQEELKGIGKALIIVLVASRHIRSRRRRGRQVSS